VLFKAHHGNSDVNPTTPNSRYFVVKGQLWRCTNPSLTTDARQRLVDELMTARREVKAAKASGDDGQLKLARARVQTAKVALGERGPVWWDDGSPDFNRCQVASTPYADPQAPEHLRGNELGKTNSRSAAPQSIYVYGYPLD
jgi:hypothetical protein